MENIKTFLFYSLAFSTGLLIYTFIVYLLYILFMTESDSGENVANNREEQIPDLNDIDCLEDA